MASKPENFDCAGCGKRVRSVPNGGPEDLPLCAGCHTRWVKAGMPDEVPEPHGPPPGRLNRTPLKKKPEQVRQPGKFRTRKTLDVGMTVTRPYVWREKGR